jgi:hypothetical protein
MSSNSLPEFYVEANSLPIVWRYRSHGRDDVWLYRLGDSYIKKVSLSYFVENFLPIRGVKINALLSQIASEEENQAKPYIYDLYSEKEDTGVWYKLYQTSLHESPAIRKPIPLKQRVINVKS